MTLVQPASAVAERPALGRAPAVAAWFARAAPHRGGTASGPRRFGDPLHLRQFGYVDLSGHHINGEQGEGHKAPGFAVPAPGATPDDFALPPEMCCCGPVGAGPRSSAERLRIHLPVGEAHRRPSPTTGRVNLFGQPLGHGPVDPDTLPRGPAGAWTTPASNTAAPDMPVPDTPAPPLPQWNRSSGRDECGSPAGIGVTPATSASSVRSSVTGPEGPLVISVPAAAPFDPPAPGPGPAGTAGPAGRGRLGRRTSSRGGLHPPEPPVAPPPIAGRRPVVHPQRGRGVGPGRPGEYDVASFESGSTQARQAVADGDLGVAVDQLDQALSLWRGPALDDVAGLRGPSPRWPGSTMSAWPPPPRSSRPCWPRATTPGW